jgi:hypothetical protein
VAAELIRVYHEEAPARAVEGYLIPLAELQLKV